MFVIRIGKKYVLVTLIILLLFSPLLYEALVHPFDYNEEYLAIDYPPRIMYNDSLYKAVDYTISDNTELILVGQIESIVSAPPYQNFQTNIEDYLHCNLYVIETAPDLLVIEYRKQLHVYMIDKK